MLGLLLFPNRWQPATVVFVSLPCRKLVSPAHDLFVSRGLEFLATQQNADGSFGPHKSRF